MHFYFSRLSPGSSASTSRRSAKVIPIKCELDELVLQRLSQNNRPQHGVENLRRTGENGETGGQATIGVFVSKIVNRRMEGVKTAVDGIPMYREENPRWNYCASDVFLTSVGRVKSSQEASRTENDEINKTDSVV